MSSVPSDGIAEVRRRLAASLAGLAGDEPTVRRFLADRSPRVRLAAFASLLGMGRIDPDDVQAALGDPDPGVRRSTCELATRLTGAAFTPLLDNTDPSVVEAAAYATGESGDRRACRRLSEIAASHADPLCRESAVAALGAIGDAAGKAAVLRALDDAPAIRRRAVVALAAFSGSDGEAALRARLADRDWQVRQAAREVLGVSASETR